MTPKSQRIAIAEACGWTVHHAGKYVAHPGGTLCDPLIDLNAMHEAEKVLKAEQQDIYACVLEEMITPDFLGDTSDLDPHIIMFRDIHATAAQRAEAFLRTLGLWKD